MKKWILSLLFLFSISVLPQGQITVNGTVKDEIGEPLIGVSITIKGSTIGTITDIDGEFSLSVPTGSTLVFSYVGYESQELIATNNMSIVLKENSMELSEVVVVGYGAQKKSALMGSVASVISQNIQKDKKDKAKTWKRSGIADNSIRLEVGDDDFISAEAIQMAVQVEGFRVRVLMDCFFFNNKKDGLEGVFKLKLPTGATPYYFAFGETEYITEYEDDEEEENVIIQNKKEIPYTEYDFEDFNLYYKDVDNSDREWESVKEARIVSKQKAAKAYEDIVSANIDPALMEWGGADMFSCRVFPLSMNTLHRVVIGYDLDMTEALDFREFVLALPKAESEVKTDICIYKSATLPLELTPALKPINETEEHIFYSLTNPKEKEILIHYNSVEPVMLIQDDSSAEDDSEEYFAASYRINLPEELETNLPTDAVIMLDASLSSNPDKFNVWITLLDEILSKNEDIIKRFALMSFNIENRWYAKHYLKNNYYNRSELIKYINTLSLEGATDISSALKEASNPSWLKKNEAKHIFLLSDADCNWGETNKHTFKYLVHQGDRIHTYKTGLSGTNMGVLDFLSKTTNGYSFTVTGEEEAQLTAKSFRYKPWKVLDIKMEGAEDFLISGNPTQLYNGQKLVFTGKGAPEGGITINVNNGKETKTLVLEAKERITSILASRVYGQIAMSYLDNYGYKAEEAAINYSTYYRIPGQYTSFLMLENSYDYEEYGAIDEYDARSFVDDNQILQLIDVLEKEEAAISLGNSKADFLAWLERLQDDNSIIDFDPSDEFIAYINGLPDEVFKVVLRPLHYNVYLSEQLSAEENEVLGNEDVRLDRVLKLAKKRRNMYGKPDALKLLSSVVERNASDIQAVRDIAMIATDWGMGDQAYYMMRRIVEWRQGEALAYLTAADALANTINAIDMALIYYYICLNSDWDSDYGSFEEIAAVRCIKYLNSLKNNSKVQITNHTREFIKYFESEVREYLDDESLLFDEADIVIITNWNIDSTDIDLHVMEPTGEECYYGNSETEIGGKLTIDVTDGYGPEMYVLENAINGTYKVMLNYYSGSRTKTASKAKVYIDVYRDWGRKNEKITHKTILLENIKDKETVIQFKVKK